MNAAHRPCSMFAADRSLARAGDLTDFGGLTSSPWQRTPWEYSKQLQTCYMDRTMTEGADESLSERAQLLLKALIENYIRDGQPVGSRTLSRDSGLSLSSATIRNVMADLGGSGLRGLAAYLGRAHTHRQGLPVLRRHSAQAQAPAPRGDRGNRAAPGLGCGQRPLAGADRVADAVECHAHGGSGDIAQPQLRGAVANRVHRACRRIARSPSW